MGLGSGEQYESRFLRECIDGGHAGIGHRRRAVGNQDFPRRVNKQESDVEQETSGQEEVRDEGITSAAAEAFSSNCRRIVLPGDRPCGCPLSLVLRPCAICTRGKKHLAASPSCILASI